MGKPTVKELSERLLDQMAQIRVLENPGESYAKAYREVLRTDEGREAFAMHHEACERSERSQQDLPGSTTDRTSAEHFSKANDASAELDALATEHSRRTGETFAKAFTHVVATERGRALYASYALQCDQARQALAADR